MRLRERCLQGLTKELKKLQNLLQELGDDVTVAVASSPSCFAARAPWPQPLPANQAATACSDADQQKGGSDSVSKAESGPRMDRLAASRSMEEIVHHIERPKLEVAEAKACLAAGCAVSLAANKIETSLGMEVREPPKEINVSGPVMRRPEDVRRLYT